nr:hypothetical protein [Tanacetum cinerariifolium]
MLFSADVRIRAEYNVKEKRRLKSVVERLGELLTVGEEEIKNLKAQLLLREAEASKAIRLHAEASNFEAVKKSLRDETNALRGHNAILEKERNALDGKVTELETLVAGMERKLTGLNALITSVKSRNDSLVDRADELEISSFRLQEKVTVDGPSLEREILSSPSYYHLRAAIGKDIEKGMHDGLSVGITHGKEDKVVVGATALSLALDVSSIWVRKIKENIANHISDFHDVLVPLAETFFIAALTGTKGTSDTAAATADATTALSITFAFVSTVAPISVDDYKVIGVDDQAVADGDAVSFPNERTSAEVRMRAEYNVKEKRRLKSVVERQGELLTVSEEEIENLKAQLLLREAKVATAIRLRAEASSFEAVEKSLRDETNALREHNVILEKERNALDGKVTELETLAAGKERELTGLNALITSFNVPNCMEQLEKFQDDQMKVNNGKFYTLYTDFMEMALHLKEKFYPHLLTTIFGRRWLFTQGMELAIIKCMNSPEYLSALRAAIGKDIEKGMHDGLFAGITHGKEGRLKNVNFPLLAELKSHKDANIKTVMDILRLEEPLMDKLGLDELQPNVDQLMVPIHYSLDKVVVGATALSLALDVSSIQVRKIKESILNHISAFRDVFVPLAEPFSITAFTCTERTFDAVAATADATTALSTTFSSTSIVAPIFVDNYKVIGVDDKAVADGDAAFFPNVDDAELDIP